MEDEEIILSASWRDSYEGRDGLVVECVLLLWWVHHMDLEAERGQTVGLGDNSRGPFPGTHVFPKSPLGWLKRSWIGAMEMLLHVLQWGLRQGQVCSGWIGTARRGHLSFCQSSSPGIRVLPVSTCPSGCSELLFSRIAGTVCVNHVLEIRLVFALRKLLFFN